MYNPGATYRIQFHKDFNFQEFEKIIPYLQKMGISTIYASPIFQATPGSMHGYDGVNPHRINPEIGTEEQLKNVREILRAHDIGWIQDIVPNHMAFHPDNHWLMDVLEKGEKSLYASYFDTPGSSLLFQGRIMVPFLGSDLEKVIKNKELSVVLEKDQLFFKYYDSQYPINLRSYRAILGEAEANQTLEKILEQVKDVLATEEKHAYAAGYDEIKKQFTSFANQDKNSTEIRNALHAFSDSSEALSLVVEEQYYRLCSWQETDSKINYRRFFTVNGLICLNIHDKKVFNDYHSYIADLVKQGIFDGLRIDHIDGLFDPSQYLTDLRELVGSDTYLVVEKILEKGELMPTEWPIQGETGYEFLSLANNLFTNVKSREKFLSFYQELVKDSTAVHEQITAKKTYILKENMGGELDNLYNLFFSLDLIAENKLKTFGKPQLKEAIAALLIHCPVYRFYGNQLPLSASESEGLQSIFDEIREHNPSFTDALDVIEDTLLKKPLEGDNVYNENATVFYQRLMQFSGPLMAKGVEDTLMYTFNNFIGHNEVGDSPESFGISIEEFHEMMVERQKNWPLAINATSTHDTKRGEDVRMRLNVLTEMPEEWLKHVQEWQKMNAGLKENNFPDANDEYFIYQTIAGAYPMPGEDEDDFQSRIQEYLQKALREAKVNSNWTQPHELYEAAAKKFAVSLLDKNAPFWKSFAPFHQKISDFGIVNSLSQEILKFTCPGVPDVYQGTEFWDLSLVDPDNRRPVDYHKRNKLIEKLDAVDPSSEISIWKDLWEERYNANIKLALINNLFELRKKHSKIFEKGEYISLETEGIYKDHVIAYGRKHQEKILVIVLPLYTSEICKEQACKVVDIDWKDTKVHLPKDSSAEWKDILNGKKATRESLINLNEIFADLPFAILLSESEDTRSAGVLLHITSLPSPFGIGDLGPEARSFADFLYRGKQKYWQLLPLNPTESAQQHSPYSSISSMAGNPLLISPELLVKDGLLSPDLLSEYHSHQEDKVDYEDASRVKGELFDTAWDNFKTGKFQNVQSAFHVFCDTEAAWLDNFAVYMALKDMHEGQPWYKWPEKYKLKNLGAIEQVKKGKADALEKTKWLQFLFFKQWKQLRAYCNKKGIQLFGDIPIYISYDSVDVWSNQEIFMLDAAGNMTGVAGVPPDYFNEDGQLWGMPVFKWDVLKQQDYKWWIQRLKVNMALFDIIRLDHFRAFADYWEVPAIEKTAKNGIWKIGPGAEFFEIAERELGKLPFVAEDLGEINDAVLELRDQFKLPGMKVLQFAFGDEMPQSPYIPHNYTSNFIVYTGTHDNNTVLGWYRQEGHKYHAQLEHYFDRPLKEHDIAIAFSKLAYASVAKTAIIPLQDLLNLGESARMNMPGDIEKNWLWKLTPDLNLKEAEENIKEWTLMYNRD